MKELNFTWDQKKSQSNLAKHGVSFPEAHTAFADDNARLIADPDHSQDEERFILLGLNTAVIYNEKGI
ncbi:BrnT family toxin [bacterium]|nr:BrnT family toxin [bacterium]